jgi:hypothetical protein
MVPPRRRVIETLASLRFQPLFVNASELSDIASKPVFFLEDGFLAPASEIVIGAFP